MTPLKAVLAGLVIVAALVGLGMYVNKRPKADEQASPSPEATSTPVIMNDLHEVTISTSLGDIVIQTYDGDAPKTVDNFVTLASKGFYNGVIFHRVIKGFMIQGGDPTGTGSGGPGYAFADELDPNTESAKRGYLKGTVAMANSGKNTNGSQFFIMHEDYPLAHDYTIFGHVVRGQDVVDKIASVKTNNPNENRPVSPVTITSVTVKELK